MADAPNNISKLLSALLSESQVLENTFRDLISQRTLDTATGTNLDVIGRIVGQKRNGMSDTDYRRYCKARIAAHRSNGAPEDLIRVARLILSLTTTSTGTVIIRAVYDATLILEIRDHAVDAATGAALLELLTVATSAGVRLVLVYSSTTLANTFRLDVGPGLDVGVLADGFDNT